MFIEEYMPHFCVYFYNVYLDLQEDIYVSPLIEDIINWAMVREAFNPNADHNLSEDVRNHGIWVFGRSGLGGNTYISGMPERNGDKQVTSLEELKECLLNIQTRALER